MCVRLATVANIYFVSLTPGRRETVDGRMRSVPVRPCLCPGTQLCTARIWLRPEIMLDKVVEFWLLRAAPAAAQ